MNYKFIIVTAILPLVFASSCTVKKVGEQEDASTDEVVESLDGIWATACVDDGSDSYIKSFRLENGSLTVATLRYVGSETCEQNKHSTTVMASGPFTVNGDSAVEGAKNYEWQIQMVVGIPYEQAMVDDLNSGSACGSTSWAVGEAGILLGCPISPNFDLTNVTYGSIHYGMYKIQENASPLYSQLESKCEVTGYAEFCPTEEDRPATFGGDVFFKQP